MLPFGWALREWTLKRRQGPHRDPWRSSSATDGRLGFADIGLRSQDSLLQWIFNDRDEVEAMMQQPPNGGPVVTIPRAKCLLFRPTAYKSNPEGRSILRTAYRSWYNFTQIENIEGIGIERDLAGLPVVKVPPEVMAGKGGGASAEANAIYRQYEQLAVNIRQNEQAGIVFPLVYDADGHELYKIELLTSWRPAEIRYGYRHQALRTTHRAERAGGHDPHWPRGGGLLRAVVAARQTCLPQHLAATLMRWGTCFRLRRCRCCGRRTGYRWSSCRMWRMGTWSMSI